MINTLIPGHKRLIVENLEEKKVRSAPDAAVRRELESDGETDREESGGSSDDSDGEQDYRPSTHAMPTRSRVSKRTGATLEYGSSSGSATKRRRRGTRSTGTGSYLQREDEVAEEADKDPAPEEAADAADGTSKAAAAQGPPGPANDSDVVAAEEVAAPEAARMSTAVTATAAAEQGPEPQTASVLVAAATAHRVGVAAPEAAARAAATQGSPAPARRAAARARQSSHAGAAAHMRATEPARQVRHEELSCRHASWTLTQPGEMVAAAPQVQQSPPTTDQDKIVEHYVDLLKTCKDWVTHSPRDSASYVHMTLCLNRQRA